MIIIPNCRVCGACCFSPIEADVYCEAQPEDIILLGPRLARKYVQDASLLEMATSAIFGGKFPSAAIKTQWRVQKAGPLKGVSVCCCVFLQGSLMHKTRCRIYNKRPRACRLAVKPGDTICKQSRQLLDIK
jgi:Fe-S-cluster containining protein